MPRTTTRAPTPATRPATPTRTSKEFTGSPFGGTYKAPNNGQNFQLWALGGTNNLFGGNGYATIISGPGADHMVGGSGKGFVDYEVAAAGVTASLQNQAVNTGEAAGDTYSNLFDLGGSATAISCTARPTTTTCWACPATT
jgi:hypothetical protein